MSDWKSRAIPAGGAGDWKSRAQAVSTESYGDEPGMLEAGLRGIEQGATLGFGDEINAAASALLDTLTGRNKDLSVLDDYVKHRDESRAAFKAAEEAHPYISGAANIAGGIAPALLTGGSSLAGQGIVGAAKLGAGYGALAGLGGSEADLTRGEVGQSIKDTATGGVMGGVLGGAVHAGAEKFGKTLKNAGIGLGTAAKEVATTPLELPMVAEPLEALKQGLQGQKLYGITANKELQEQFIQAHSGLASKLASAENAASSAKTQGLLKANERVDMYPWLKAYNSMSKNLRSSRGADEKVISDLDKVGSYIQRVFMGADDEGVARQLEPGGMLPKDIEAMYRKLQSWSPVGANELQTNEGRLLVTRLLAPLEREASISEAAMQIPDKFTPLKPLLNKAVPGLKEQNAAISQIEKAKEVMPNLNDLMNVEKTSQSGTTALQAFEDFFKVAPKDVVGSEKERLLDLAKGRDIANKISAPGLSHGFLANTVRGTLLTGANMTGAGLRGLYNMAPEALKDLSKAVASEGSQAGQKLSVMLSNAAEKDNIGRNALFFAIQQNPEYRRILRNAAGIPEEDKK
jgi:hypothetical protein